MPVSLRRTELFPTKRCPTTCPAKTSGKFSNRLASTPVAFRETPSLICLHRYQAGKGLRTVDRHDERQVSVGRVRGNHRIELIDLREPRDQAREADGSRDTAQRGSRRG